MTIRNTNDILTKAFSELKSYFVSYNFILPSLESLEYISGRVKNDLVLNFFILVRNII